MQQSRTIFMVDDDVDDQEIFSTALSRVDNSVNCVFAENGIEALQKLATDNFNPDLIFLDLNMPRMNGHDCLLKIKKIDRLKDVPVYIYSTNPDPDLKEKHKDLGVTDFLVKPSNIKDLTEMLSGIIKRRFVFACLVFTFFMCATQQVYSQKKPTYAVKKLKKLSVSELMDIEVISVSRNEEKLTEAASAIQVLTGEDIQRSPTTTLPEILRLAPNLQVARAGSHDWSVTARGFNGAAIANSSLADKLLVMIDGRTVYNPLFGGVYWDVQNIVKDNVDRIEVVSGPGGTLWGANAVNGVINVITKNAKETQGLNVSGSAGTFLRDGFAFTYGSHIDTSFYFRVVGQRFDYNSTSFRDSTDAHDQWDMTRFGFRSDYMKNAKNHVTVQGDYYWGNEDEGDSTQVRGGNVLGRWTHTFSNGGDLSIQAYFDNTWRDFLQTKTIDRVNTVDIEVQNRLKQWKHNRLTLGGGFRTLNDFTPSPDSTFEPTKRNLNLYSIFVQDQLTLVPKRLEFTIGTKLQHNDYTGWEWQPSARLAWTPNQNQTIWASVSRAVRTPSRFDEDIRVLNLVQHEPFKSEKVIAYEMGYRFQPVEKVSFSLATYYNMYTDLRSFDLSGFPVAPTIFGNHLKAEGWGAELSFNYIIANWWRLRGGYTYQDKKFTTTSLNTLPGTESLEAVDPHSFALVQSILDLPQNFEVDVLSRYVSELPVQTLIKNPAIPAYFALDMRVGWTYRHLSLGISVQNLTDISHVEYGNKEIPRSIHGKIGLRF